MRDNKHMAEIHDVGQQVDTLQDLFASENLLSCEIIEKVQAIDGYFNKSMPYENDLDFATVYYYTRANYLTVLLELSNKHFGEMQKVTESLSDYSSFEDVYHELIVKRMSFMRDAVSCFAKNENSLLSKQWMAQVHTNLANLYMETGRILESIEELEKVKFDIGMAMGNYAAKLFKLSECTLDQSEQKETLCKALTHYKLVVEKGKDDASIYAGAYDNFCASEDFIQRLLKDKYDEISIYTDIPDDYFKETDLDTTAYRKWCRENRLALSFRNIVEKNSNTDEIHLPNLGISYFGKDDSLSYYSWFNTVKQEYNMARYALYKTENSNSNFDAPHISQRDILLINTLDYPAVGYRTELLKLALKGAYGVLDKIGILCSDFMGLPKENASRISFTSWFRDVEKAVALHSEFSSLYWLARDLDYKKGSYKIFRKLRNVVEHRFLRVLDNALDSIDVELEDDNKLEYKISYCDLYEQTWKVIRLVRYAIIYLVFSFNACYKSAMIDCEKGKKMFMPLGLDIYEDEWKN